MYFQIWCYFQKHLYCEFVCGSDFSNCESYIIFQNTFTGNGLVRPINFTDEIFKCFFLNENAWIFHKISLRFVRQIRINNIPVFVQIMSWCRAGDKPLSETIMVRFPTHICVTRPQWVKTRAKGWHFARVNMNGIYSQNKIKKTDDFGI